MNVIKRATTLVGVIALAASSLLASDAMAQGIGTTITVDNTPACVDATPTSLIATQGTNTPHTFGDPLSVPTGAGVNFVNKQAANNINVDMYVNQCLGQNWVVTASISDFSGPVTVDAAGKVVMYAQSGGVFMGITIDYTKLVRPKANPAANAWSNPTVVPGTTGLPVGAHQTASGRTFISDGPGSNSSTLSHSVSSGTVESTGDMRQSIKIALAGVPTTTPQGTYAAVMTFTFTSTGP